MAGPNPAKSYSLSNCAALVSSDLHDRAAILFAWPNQNGTSARKSIQLFLSLLPHLDFPANHTHGQLWADKRPLQFKKKKICVLRKKRCILMLICWSNSRATKGRELKIPGTSLPASEQGVSGEAWCRLSAWSCIFAGAQWPSEEQICSSHRYTGGFSWLPKNQRWLISPSFRQEFNPLQGKLPLRISCSDAKLLLTWYWAKAGVVLSPPKNGEKGYAGWEQSKSPVD